MFTSSWAITADCSIIPTSRSCFETLSSGARVDEELFCWPRARSHPAFHRPTSPTTQSAALLLPERRGGSHALCDGRDTVLCRSGGQIWFSRRSNEQLGGFENHICPPLRQRTVS